MSENPKSIAASVQVEASVLPLFERALRCAQRNDGPVTVAQAANESLGFDSRKLTVDDMTRLSRFYAL